MRVKKEKKKEPVIKNCLDVIPIRSFDEDLAAFKLKDKSYMDILRIIPRDIDNMSDDELQMEMLNLEKIFKTVAADMKFISINFPLSTQPQKESLYQHESKTEDSVRKKWINRQLEELEKVERGILKRDFYVFFFAENEKEFIKTKETILKYTQSGHIKLTSEIDMAKKIHIISKICNMNTTEDLQEDIEYIPAKTAGNKREKKEFLDEELFEFIQPKGGATFKEPSYITFGDGYVRCLHVYALPTYINEFWLMQVFNIPNCICSLDVSSKDMNEVKKNINRSISEENARYVVAKNHEEMYDSMTRSHELQELFDNVSRLGEVIKLCDFRIFIKASTLSELEERTDNIFKDLEADGYKTTALLNEQKTEWISFFEPYKKTHERPFMMKGLTMTSTQLSEGFPFDYSELLDQAGVLLGFSKTGGTILYDQFTKSKKRQHYNSIVFGNMGSGKSTHLKKIFKHAASIGNYIRTFDISGEFTKLTLEFGGKIIKCNRNAGMLNPLEILKAGEDDYVSYANHISKLQSFFQCIIPSMSDELKIELANQLQQFYAIYALTPSENRNITGLKATDYPTLSNFSEFLKKSIEAINMMDRESLTDVETSLNVTKAQSLYVILGAAENLTKNYGELFDGHTSIDNIEKEKIVTFDISDIKELGNIFAAQMQNMVSLCWDNAVENGESMKELWESGDANTDDITKFLILIDESHRWVNTSMPQILSMIMKYEREARKYFAGIILASQSVRDFMPEANAKELEMIKGLFELSQYKFIFKQDSSQKEYIEKIFGGELTSSQVERIPFLEAGETILSIAGDMSIEFKEWLSPEYEESLFAGGR